MPATKKPAPKPEAPPPALFEIHDVEGCAELTVELRPGVNVLTGENGAGKTSAIRAITRASGGDLKLGVRDGAVAGRIIGPGVVVQIGIRTTAAGEPTVDLIDVGSVAAVIDPQMKGKAESERARIKALLELVPLKLTDAQLKKLAPGGVVHEPSLRNDPPAAADAARRLTHELARDAEILRDEAAGRLKGLEEQRAKADAAGIEDGADVPSPEDAESALNEAIRRKARLEGEHEGRESLRRQQEAIRGKMPEERPNVDGAKERATVAAAAYEEAAIVKREARRENDAAHHSLDSVEIEAEQFDAFAAILDQPLEGATAEQVAAAGESVERARATLQLAHRLGSVRDLDEQLKAATVQRDEGAAAADRFRAHAAGIADTLTDVLAGAGLKGLTVVDGALVVKRGKKTEPFSRLSLGQRTKLVAEIVAKHCPGKTVPIDPAFWNGLDPKSQGAIAKAATAAGVFFVTEHATDDAEISVETLT